MFVVDDALVKELREKADANVLKDPKLADLLHRTATRIVFLNREIEQHHPDDGFVGVR